MNLIKLVLAEGQEIGGEFQGIGPIGTFEKTIGGATRIFNQLISNIVGIMTVVGGIWFTIQFLSAGLAWISAGGDKGQMEAARQKITQAIVGLGIIVAAIFIVNIIGNILGFNILSPGEFIRRMWT